MAPSQPRNVPLVSPGVAADGESWHGRWNFSIPAATLRKTSCTTSSASAPVTCIGEHQGQPYLALELLEGGSLEGKIAGKPQAPRDAAVLVQVLARAMQYAHSRGIVHRDLKPSNVLLTAEGTAKIADFGLAKFLHTSEGQTQEGDVVG